MQIFPLGALGINNLHEISKPVFWENIITKNISKCGLLKFLLKVLSIKIQQTKKNYFHFLSICVHVFKQLMNQL